MAKLTPAQDKAIQAFGADGEFPKGTRTATIEGIRTAGLIEHWNGDDSWDLTADGREYLGLAPIANTTTTDEIVELLDAPHGTLLCDQAEAYSTDAPFSVESFIDSLPREWSQDYREHNMFIWANMSASEIKKDMRTAVPIGRAGIRAMNKR